MSDSPSPSIASGPTGRTSTSSAPGEGAAKASLLPATPTQSPNVQRHEQRPDPTAFALYDAQRVLARSYGFTSWQKLKSYVQTIQPYSPARPKVPADDAEQVPAPGVHHWFRRRSSFYGESAAALRRKKPHLAKANNIYTAAVGDVAAAADFMAKNVDAACESGAVRLGTAAIRGVLTTRQRSRRALDVRSRAAVDRAWPPTRTQASCGRGAGVLAGAADGSARPGRGRRGAWRRAAVAAAASTLGRVRRGSCSREAPTPTTTRDCTTACNNRNGRPLEAASEYGLGKDQGGPWFKRFWQHWPYADARSPADILAYQSRWAVAANYFDRVRLFVENAVDVNHPDRGRTPYAEAVYGGQQQIADYLVAKGAKRIAITLSKTEEFHIACYRDDADRVREFVASDPSLLKDAEGTSPSSPKGGCANSVLLVGGTGR